MAGCSLPTWDKPFAGSIRTSTPRSYNYTNLLDILRSYPDLFEVRSNNKTPPYTG